MSFGESLKKKTGRKSLHAATIGRQAVRFAANGMPLGKWQQVSGFNHGEEAGDGTGRGIG